MRVGIIQPNFIPWRGYFDFIRSVDLFILLDDVQYTRRDWRNRNKIKTPQGTQWLVVPVHYHGQQMRLADTLIDDTQPWRKKHAGTWQANYADTPFYEHIQPFLKLISESGPRLNDLNVALTRAIADYLQIDTPIMLASELGAEGEGTLKLISLLKRVNATRYLSGPSAENYLDKQMFMDQRITLEYKGYGYLPYPQQWGAFDGAVSVLDLIANCGENAREYLQSQTPDRVIVAL